MTERISGTEVRKGSRHSCRECAGWCAGCWETRLAAQVDRDAARIAELERERDDFADRLTVAQEEAEPLQHAAANWRAFVACRDHPMRDKEWGVGLYGDECYCWSSGSGADMRAPDFPALLARLDALKPKPEVWRWVWSLGGVSPEVYPSARAAWDALGKFLDGHPFRETVAPDGTITLTPEAK